jgi:hypothetical protein
MVVEVEWTNPHQQMDNPVVLVVVVVIILVPDLVDLELLAKEILAVLDIGNLSEHTMEVVGAVLDLEMAVVVPLIPREQLVDRV